jgi:proline iminopeptidase
MPYVAVEGAELFVRETGRGPPIIVVHGGPDFDHSYLLPDLDRLADSYRLIYYDQRCRGRSRGELRLDDIHMDRYVADLDAVREHIRLDQVAILGHSWGAFVALHYALRHSARVSNLVLLNPASACNADLEAMRVERHRRWEPRKAQMDALAQSAQMDAGDPATVAAYYALDFATTFKRAEDARRLKLDFAREDILRGRAIEDRLATGLYWVEGYTLLPQLAELRVPTLVIHGALDFFPVESSKHIADAIPGAQLVVIPDSGHFSYIDAPEKVRAALGETIRCNR